jgi:hypothetical protein
MLQADDRTLTQLLGHVHALLRRRFSTLDEAAALWARALALGERRRGGASVSMHHLPLARGSPRGRLRFANLLLLEFEPDSHLDLEVRDLILLDVCADAPNLNPVQPAQCLRGTRDACAHRFRDAVRRGAGDLDDSVGI